MSSTIFKKVLPIPSLWPFLLTSLALHGFLGLALMQAVLFPKPASVERIITVQIIEGRAIGEEVRIPPPVFKMEKKIPTGKEKENKKDPLLFITTPVEKEISPAPLEWPKEEISIGPKEEFRSPGQETPDPLSSSPLPAMEKGLSPPGVAWLEEETSPTSNKEGLKSPKQGAQDGPIITEAEGKAAEIAGGTVGTTTGGHGKTAFSMTGEGKAGPRVLLLQKGGKGPGPGAKRGFQSSARGEGPGGRNLSGYLSAVRLKIEKTKRYPGEAQRKRWEGKVILSFQIDRQGEVRDIRVIQSSGYRILDEEGMATLRRASPFPSPLLIEKESLVVEVPILFRLEAGR
jgi:TonB family protein